MSNSPRHESHPRWHKSARNNPIDIIYKYVTGGSGGAAKIISDHLNIYVWRVGFIDTAQIKKKENSIALRSSFF